MSSSSPLEALPHSGNSGAGGSSGLGNDRFDGRSGSGSGGLDGRVSSGSSEVAGKPAASSKADNGATFTSHRQQQQQQQQYSALPVQMKQTATPVKPASAAAVPSAPVSGSTQVQVSTPAAPGPSVPESSTPMAADTFDLKRPPEQHELIKLVRIVTRLYCHGISQEFRRPVHLMYPEIALHYIKSIREPMDLGSLLFLLLKSKQPLQYIRHKLRLIFANAVAFNADAHQMIAISTHINQFAKALWQEVISLPYAGDNISKNAFKVDRYIHRFNRYRFVCVEKMTTFEGKEIMNGFTSILKQFSCKQTDVSSADQRFINAFVALSKNLRSLVDENFARLEKNMNSPNAVVSDVPVVGGHNHGNPDVNNLTNHRVREQKTINEMKMELPNAGLHYLKTTLSELIEPFAKEVMAIITNGFGGDGSEKKGRTISLPIFLVYHYNSFYAKVEVSPFLYNWLQVIDDVIAELLPGGVERLTRGFPLSCVWARPHRIVWAQPPKDAWWPGMVLAGHGVPKALAAANFSRIPDEIARQLLKIKPKVTENAPMPVKPTSDLVFNGRTVEDSIATDNCVLVEFFGSHDFGWIKLDQLTPFPTNGAFVPPVLPPETTATERAKRERCQQPSSPSVREALSSLQALETCDAVAKGDDAPPPSMEELTEIHHIVQDAMILFQKQSQPQSKNKGRSTSSASVAQVGKGPPVKIPKAFGDLIDITGPNAVSIHKLSPQDLGLTVASTRDVIKNGVFNSDAVQLHYGLSLQDRALWRTRIMATALDQIKPLFPPGQEVIRPKPFIVTDVRSRGGRGAPPVASGNSKNAQQQLERELLDKFTTRYASNNSTIKRKMAANGNKSLSKQDEDRRKFRKRFKDFDEIIDMIPINTNALYTASAETGRKWMIGIFAPGEMTEDAVTQVVGGDGALHSRRINFSSQLFNMEAKKRISRKELLKQEIGQMENLLKSMKEHAAKGDLNMFPSSSLAAALQNRDSRVNQTHSSNSQFVMEGVSGITAADVTTASLTSTKKKRKPRNRSASNEASKVPKINSDGSIRKKPGPKTKAEKMAATAASSSSNNARKFVPLSAVMNNSRFSDSKPLSQSPADSLDRSRDDDEVEPDVGDEEDDDDDEEGEDEGVNTSTDTVDAMDTA